MDGSLVSLSVEALYIMKGRLVMVSSDYLHSHSTAWSIQHNKDADGRRVKAKQPVVRFHFNRISTEASRQPTYGRLGDEKKERNTW